MNTQLITKIGLLTGLLLLTGCLYSSCSPQAKFKETLTINVEHISEKGLNVRSANGALTAEKSDRADVEIIAHIRATTAERLAAVKIIAERGDDQTLNVYAKWPEKRKNREGCSFEIKLPDANNVDMHTSNGAITCSGLAGKGTLTTSNGRIKVDSHDGPLNVSTSNGAIGVKNLSGALNASTSNGAIAAENIGKSAELRTSNGRIKAINVVSPVSAHTSNGAIELALAKEFTGEMKASTVNGALNISGFDDAKIISSNKKYIHFKIGESDDQSFAKTSNGAVTIRPY